MVIFAYSLLLKSGLLSRKLLLLLPHKILHHFLFLLHLRSSLIIVYTLQSILIIHKLTVILLIHSLFLCFKRIPHSNLLIKFLLFPFPFFLLSLLNRFLVSKFFLHRFLILIHISSFPFLLKLKHSLIILQHILLILNFPFSLFFLFMFFLLHCMFILIS